MNDDEGTIPKRQRVETFEDLNVYKQARNPTNRISEITRRNSFSNDYGLVDQVRRASESIMLNIADGFERGTNTEFIRFLCIAKGSCGEARSQLSIACDQGYISENDYNPIVDQCRRVSGMLSNLIPYLKGSRFRGTKYRAAPKKSLAEELNEIIQQIRSGQHHE
jgi:four helix bundle protein